MKPKILALIVIMALAGSNMAQESVEKSQSSAIDKRLKRVMQEWERPDRPGGVVAVVQKGEVVFKKCYGQANAEYQNPNTPKTVFDVASVAEPVTGMAIAMLEEQGKLSASDSVRKHIPELPGFADEITIAHLLHHTSGLIDWLELITLAGWNERDVITHDHIWNLLTDQKEPLFEPGSKHLYSRTDYTLLAEIVKRISGQPFREWAWINIFKPLKMTRTLFRDDHREIIENRAYSISYSHFEGYLRGADNLAVVGSTSLFTTLDDFIRWIVNLETQSIVSAGVIAKMTTSGKLSDGREAGHSYGFQVDTYRGLRRMFKNGNWGGFRSAFHYYPEYSLGVIAFVNWDYNVYNPVNAAENIAGIYLKSHIAKKRRSKPVPQKKKPIELSPDILKTYEGQYRMGPGSYLKVEMKESSLTINVGGSLFRLAPLSETEFLVVEFGMPAHFEKDAEGCITGFTFQGNTSPRVEIVALSKEQLKDYVGSYVNNELGIHYDIALRDENLVLSSLRGKDITLIPENRKSFAGRSRVFNTIAFKTDINGEIAGFRVDTSHLRPFVFEKTMQ